jgi:hypothetical protein
VNLAVRQHDEDGTAALVQVGFDEPGEAALRRISKRKHTERREQHERRGGHVHDGLGLHLREQVSPHGSALRSLQPRNLSTRID